ncbi:hypothetical protein [Calidifontibacillus erzurumensis]|uniref:hypothetical protein n=1 Tax=Calidifontibacillus erzurumensis TaxID=2741433 RepID=UPI0035B5398C
MMTLADMWREEGMKKGLEMGQVQALSDIAIMQLTSKLGDLPQDVKESIKRADISTLRLILSNIFTIETVDDVKRFFDG